MATSKLIKGDTLTETSNAADGFNPATEVSNYSYTSARVAKPVYNKYKAATTKPKVFGYYTDWSQYDGRLQGDDSKDNRGRGYDLTNISPTAYDKIIVGFVGVTGFHKMMVSIAMWLPKARNNAAKSNMNRPSLIRGATSSLTLTLATALAAGTLIRKP